MNKTIEELAKQYAEDKCPVGDYCGGIYDEQRNSDLTIYIDDAKSVLRWLFDKPLIDRMTAEEKERVRKIYYDAERGEVNSHYDVYPGPCEIMRVIFGKDFLRVIFGKDFFKEGE